MKTSPIIIAGPLTREQSRQVDRLAIEQYGMSGLVLMENAGRGVAEWLVRNVLPGHVCVLCGKGNNAGDGYVIARHLELFGWPTSLVQLYPPDQLSGDALVNWNISQRAGIETFVYRDEGAYELAAAVSPSKIVIDCMLGTGASGDPREPIATAIRMANEADVVRIAVDTPSGLDCDSGQLGNPHFVAHHTCTMVARKVGFENLDARPALGEIHIIGIGLPRALLQSLTPADAPTRCEGTSRSDPAS